MSWFSNSFFRSAYHQPTSYRPRLLIAGEPGYGQSSHLAPAVIHALEKFAVYTLELSVLFGISTTSPEETCAQVIFVPHRQTFSDLWAPWALWAACFQWTGQKAEAGRGKGGPVTLAGAARKQ